MKLTRKHVLMIVAAILIGIPVLGLLTFSTKNRVMMEQGTMGFQTAPSMGRAEVMMDNSGIAKTTLVSTEGRSMMPIAPGYGNEGFTPGVDRVIVKNASMSLLVDDTRQAANKVSEIALQAQGTVTQSNIYENDNQTGQIFANLILRVPVEQTETVMASIRQVATKVVSENLTAQDRTEQKIDLDAQLKNLRATEAQLQTIMAQANTVEETLKVQTELGNVRGQIERLQAQLENLLGDAAMATISVSMSTEEAELPIVDDSNRSIVQEIKLAVRDTVTLYRNLFVSGLRLAILSLPVIVIGGIIFGVWRKKKK